MKKIKRTKILYHILFMLIFVSICPLCFYGWQLIKLNREKLETNEKLSQIIVAKSLAHEIAQYLNAYREQILTFASAIEIQGGIANLQQSSENLLLQKKLEDFVTRSKNLLYINIVNSSGKGVRAGSYNADDPLIQRFFRIAFMAASKNQSYISEPLAIEINNDYQPVIIMSAPINSVGQWIGVTTIILGLDDILRWVTENSVGAKTIYVVDTNGRIVVHPDYKNILTGMDFSKIEIVHEFAEVSNNFQGNPKLQGTRPFLLKEGRIEKEMLGTYYAIPEVSWGVIVQIDQKEAFATVYQMKRETIKWGILMLCLAILVGLVSARSITTPIQQLAESTRFISRGDFSKKISIRSHTEIGELADTFNKMTDDLRLYIDQIKRAAQENKDLFLGTIKALAAAIDEKDPYTRGHSERVTQYSIIIAKKMGLDDSSIEILRIAALLHDVGKIGVDDNILKKPDMLTPAEFDLMKQHPVKGANIMKAIEPLRNMIPGMKYHHEQWDGNGYPDHLKGEDIPLIARIISVADVFDAMTTTRPYQNAQDLHASLKKIQMNARLKYDPEVVEALTKVVEDKEIVLDPTTN